MGGVVLLVLFFLLLYCIRKQGRPVTPEELEKKKKKLKEKDIISPFIIPQPTSEPTLSSAGTSGSPTSASGTTPQHHTSDARAEKARLAMAHNNMARNFFTPGAIERLPTELTANSTVGESSPTASSVSTNDTSNPLVSANRRKGSKSKLAEELRRERERLDKQIAELERRTSVGGSRAPTRRNDTENDEMLAQLAALREQMSVVQARQTPVPSEPPPDYYPASITGHSSRH